MFRQYLDDNSKKNKKDYEISYIRRVKETAKAKKNKSKKQDKSIEIEDGEEE